MPTSSPFLDACVDPDRAGQAQALDPAGLRQEGARVLGVEAHLDRMPAGLGLELEPLAAGDPQLPFDEIDAGHRLGDRMLDLDPAVQLEEGELATVEHELGRARADVADGAREADRRLAHPRAELAVERGRGRLLEHLLVAALHRALALAEGEHRPVGVGEELDLDVARPLEVALEEEPVVAEGRAGLPFGRLDRRLELGLGAHDSHAAAAAAGGGLDEQRKADLLRRAAGHDRNTRGAGDFLGGLLVAYGSQGGRRRPHPAEPGCFDGGCEVGALGEKAVAGMNGIGAARMRGAHDLLRIEVRRDLDRLAGRPRVQRAAVVGRRNRDRGDPERARGAEDPQRDLAAVGYEELANLHSPASVSSATAERARYGTASELASATAPPIAAPPLCPGAQARLISAKA